MLEWWRFILIEVAIVVVIALVMLLVSLPDIRRYLRIRRI